MKINISPYYCPHCERLKAQKEITYAYGSRIRDMGGVAVCEEGYLPFCKGCGNPVEETKPIIDAFLFAIIKETASNLQGMGWRRKDG